MESPHEEVELRRGFFAGVRRCSTRRRDPLRKEQRRERDEEEETGEELMTRALRGCARRGREKIAASRRGRPTGKGTPGKEGESAKESEFAENLGKKIKPENGF